MELILLRHGKAEDSHPQGDGTRALVDKGRKQARRAGRILKAAEGAPEIVLTSPLVRAVQTAEEFCRAAELPGRDLHVVDPKRRNDIFDGKVVTGESVRVQPDPHRVLRAEILNLTDSGHA